MDFITTTIIGGLIYDSFKMGMTEYGVLVNDALKELVLTEEEKALIAQDFSSATALDVSSKDNLEQFFANNAPNTQKIVNKYTQENTTYSNQGDVILGNQQNSSGSGDNIGTKHETNNYYGNPPQGIDEKKH